MWVSSRWAQCPLWERGGGWREIRGPSHFSPGSPRAPPTPGKEEAHTVGSVLESIFIEGSRTGWPHLIQPTPAWWACRVRTRHTCHNQASVDSLESTRASGDCPLLPGGLALWLGVADRPTCQPVQCLPQGVAGRSGNGAGARAEASLRGCRHGGTLPWWGSGRRNTSWQSPPAGMRSDGAISRANESTAGLCRELLLAFSVSVNTALSATNY